MKFERTRKDFLSIKEYASAGDRKGKLSNIGNEGDGAIEAVMKAELQRAANSDTLNFQENFLPYPSPTKQIKPMYLKGKGREQWKMVLWWNHIWEQ